MKINFLFAALLLGLTASAQQDSTKAENNSQRKSKSITILGVDGGSNQVAIIGNISDTSTVNTQTAGIFNIASGNVSGLQLAGVTNIANDSISGAQISGVVNLSKKASGLQIGGFGNITQNNFRGAQIGGTLNITGGTLELLQAAGSINYAGALNGFQVSGAGNIVSGSVRGAQFSGGFNFAGKPSEAIQLGGSINYATDLKGAQLGGFLNIANGNLRGAQVSGCVNYARSVNGLQLGIFNFADSIDGVSIGVFSFVRHGYHKLEISTSESMLFNSAFHTGSHFFHNIISINATKRNNDVFWSYGYGIGSAIKASPRFDICIDLTGSHVNRNNFNERVSELGRLDLIADFHITKNISLFAGPSFNVFIYDIQGIQGEDSMAAFVPYDFYNQTFNSRWTVRSWIGWKAGFRFF